LKQGKQIAAISTSIFYSVFSRGAVSPLKIKIHSKNMREKPTNTPIIYVMYGISYMFRHYITILRERSLCLLRAHHVTRHNTPINNILSTAPQLSISQEALGTLPEDGNVMLKHVGAAIHNKMNE
jgi:hypothetical protein